MDNNKTTGNIHTAMLEITAPDALMRTVNDSRITSDYYTQGGSVRRLRMNANRGTLYSLQTGRRFFQGECETLEEFECSLQAVLSKARISVDDASIIRIDFKFDYADPAHIREWIKLCDLLIGAFVTKHKVTEKNQYRCTSLIKGTHKSTQAKWGRFEIVNYNKAIQQGSGGTLYRLEIRCIDTKGKPTYDILQEWRRELTSLKQYYDKALTNWNNVLLAKWQAMKDTAHEPIKLNEFIRWNLDYIFTRSQLRGLYALAGARNPQNATKHFCDNCGKDNRLFVTKGMYEQFIDILCLRLAEYTAKIYPPQVVFSDDISTVNNGLQAL